MARHTEAPVRSKVIRLAQLASYMVRPLDYVHNDHLLLPTLDAQALRTLTKRAAFRTPFDRTLSESLGLSTLRVARDISTRLDTDEDLNITLALLQSKQAMVLNLAGHCAAIQLFAQIRSCVLKSQRQRLERILGSGAFLAALRQSEVFFPCLSERSRQTDLDSYLNDEILTDGSHGSSTQSSDNRAESVHPVLWEGLATLIAFARRADKGCAKILALRFPKPSVNIDNVEITAPQAQELKTLLRRRGLAW
jgi:hypothetical protein